jgi:hypothetical protein
MDTRETNIVMILYYHTMFSDAILGSIIKTIIGRGAYVITSTGS